MVDVDMGAKAGDPPQPRYRSESNTCEIKGCIMYENIDDYWRVVTCRKDHHCEWCPEPIAKGEKAVVRRYKWDGEFVNSHMHPECREALSASVQQNLMYEDGAFDCGEQKRGCLMGVA